MYLSSSKRSVSISLTTPVIFSVLPLYFESAASSLSSKSFRILVALTATTVGSGAGSGSGSDVAFGSGSGASGGRRLRFGVGRRLRFGAWGFGAVRVAHDRCRVVPTTGAACCHGEDHEDRRNSPPALLLVPRPLGSGSTRRHRLRAGWLSGSAFLDVGRPTRSVPPTHGSLVIRKPTWRWCSGPASRVVRHGRGAYVPSSICSEFGQGSACRRRGMLTPGRQEGF